MYSQLFSYSLLNKKYQKVNLPFNLGSIYGIKSVGNTLWISSSSGIITYNLNTKKSNRIDLKKDGVSFPYMANEFIFQTGRDSILWIATRYTQTGLIKYNLVTQETSLFSEGINRDNSLSSNELFSLFLDHDRNWLWIGGKSGLDIFHLGEQKFYHFYQSDGLPNNTVYTITEDLNKRMWLSTNYGISHVDIISDEDVKLKFHNYTLSHGLSNLEYNQNSSHIDSDGKLYFGGNKGIDIITPPLNDLHDDMKKSIIEFIKTDNDVRYFPHVHEILSSSSKDIQIGIRQINFGDHSGVKYKIESNSYSKTSLTYEDEVNFSNLPSGNYLISIWPEGDELNKESITFYIPPKYYETLWFKVLVVLLIVGVIASYFIRQKLYQKKLQKDVEDRTKELKEATKLKNFLMDTIVHDMKNPLNSILLISENELTGQPKQKVFFFAQQILNLFSDLLDTHKFELRGVQLKNDVIPVSKVINKALINTSYVSKEKNIKIRIVGELNFYIKCDEKLIIRVITNLLTNAIKFSSDFSEVVMECKKIDHEIYIYIKDNGSGIDQESTKHIFEPYSHLKFKTLGFSRSTGVGLSFCKLVMEAHGKTISVQSSIGEGSVFSIHLDYYEEPKSTHKLSKQITQKLKKYDVHDASIILKVIKQFESGENKNALRTLENILYEGDQHKYESYLNEQNT